MLALENMGMKTADPSLALLRHPEQTNCMPKILMSHIPKELRITSSQISRVFAT